MNDREMSVVLIKKSLIPFDNWEHPERSLRLFQIFILVSFSVVISLSLWVKLVPFSVPTVIVGLVLLLVPLNIFNAYLDSNY